MVQIKLERIGDDQHEMMRFGANLINQNIAPGIGASIVGKPPRREWCAEITGTDPKYRFARRFLAANVSYREANSVGSRGVFAFYNLENGKLYEIKEPVSRARTDRYFAIVENNQLQRITEAEATEWLRAKLHLE